MWHQIALIALAVTCLTIFTSYPLGLVDRPDSRKLHSGEVPLIGGIAIFITVLTGTLVLGIPLYNTATLVIAGLTLLIGTYDDRFHLSPATRLVLQYVSGILLATVGGITIKDVGNLLAMGNIPLLYMAIPLTALSVAGLCNAYNMIDGIDGLAAAMIALPLLTLYALALAADHPMSNTLLLLLIPLAIFLCFNLGPDSRLLPRIFLGDGGSMTLGFLVTASLVYFSQGTEALIAPVTALWLVTVPLMDMIATMLRRHLRGRRLMEADRQHLHHLLINRGLGARQVLVVLIVYACLCSITGLALEQVPASVSLLLYVCLFLGHCLFVVKAPDGEAMPL